MKKKIRFNRVLIICLVIYLFYVFISKQQVLATYKKEGQNYMNLISQEQQRNAELLETRDNINSTEYIEEIARDKLGMYLPNERVYIDINK